MRDLADAALHPRLARLPGAAAQPVEHDAGFLRAVAREQFDILDRQEQLVAFGVMDFEAVMRRARRLDGLQPDETPDAVVDMHDRIAGRQTGGFGNEIFRPARRATRPHQPVAENVLLADDSGIVGLESGFQPEHRERDVRLGPGKRLRPRPHIGEIGQAMVAQHMAHAVARALAPQRHHHALVRRLQRLHMLGDGVEYVCIRFRTFGREIVSLPRADLDHAALPSPSGTANGVSFASGRSLRRCFHSVSFRYSRSGGSGRYGTPPGPVRRLSAGFVIVGDLFETLMRGVFSQRLDHQRRARDIVEQRFKPVVKQRQPMLHAGIAAALAHRFVQHVVARRRAERRDIAGTEFADGVGGQLEFGDRHEIERAHVVLRALGLRIEHTDRFQRIAEEIEPRRIVHAGRKQVEDAAAHGIFAGLAHGRGADIAVELEPAHHPVHAKHIAGRGRQRLTGNHCPRRDPLQDRVHRGQQHRRPVAALHIGEPRQRDHALRQRGGMRRHAVIGQAIPGREFQHCEIGREKGNAARQSRHARTIAAHDHKADGRRIGFGRDRARQIAEHQTFGAVGDIRKRQRLAGAEQISRRTRHQSLPPGLFVKGAQPAQQGRRIRRGRDTLAGDPAIKIVIGHFQQLLIFIKFGVCELGNAGIGEAAHQQIHLADAAMPGAEQQPAAARLTRWSAARGGLKAFPPTTPA